MNRQAIAAANSNLASAIANRLKHEINDIPDGE
jgi:hypothetical protein